MSLAFTVIKCDGLNGVKDRPCAALLSIPGTADITYYLHRAGWLTIEDHMCPGCRPDRKPSPSQEA